MKKFDIPIKYKDHLNLKKMYTDNKVNPEDNVINYLNLVSDIIDQKDENDFFNFKDVNHYIYK